MGIGPGGGPCGVVGSSMGWRGGGIGDPGSPEVESRLRIRCTPASKYVQFLEGFHHIDSGPQTYFFLIF